ncbi:MAG TPA: histidine kinase dimerization/phosphoacceptor domain -containing protein [Thermoguttaceae bacterium]|nr:histidine kinase dimerization/phosphoacceptor domain -containing protein [Thermoguttaceae bacterium]
MRIGLKLTAAFLSIASLVGAAGYLARHTSRELERQMELLSRSAIVKVAGTTEMTVALYAGQLAAHGLVSAERRRSPEDLAAAGPPGLHGPVGRHQETVEQGLAQQHLAAESLVRWAADQGSSELAERETTETLPTLDRLEQQFAEHQRLMGEFLALVDEDADRAERFLEDRVCPHFESSLLPILAGYRERAEREFTQGIRTAERAMAVADERRGLLIVAAAASAVLMGLVMSRSIGKPLSMLKQAALEMGRGRLDTRVAIRSRDEIGVLGGALNQMAADLEETTVSKGYLDNIIRSMREMLIVADPKMRIRHVNPAVCAELGYTEEELTGRSLGDLFAAEDLPVGVPLPETLGHRGECRMKGKSGGLIPVYCSAAEMPDEAGRPGGVVCVASNISRQKEVEERLRASLGEKELLLKEVHHRVKNNLQVISSLLSLQAQELRDPRMVRLFQESQGRIRSMALIHEQLYRSTDLAHIDFAAYAHELIGHVSQGLGNGAARVNIRLEIQPLPLPLDLAIPCGMIVNELVANALEHAFPDGRAGEIRVGLSLDDAGYLLTVADNGVGMPGELSDGEATSMGLKVVQALARQIHGKLDVQLHEGTAFAIHFEGPEGRRPPDAEP